jgi:DNA-binding CsgD family transcriptional regulator
LDRVLLSSISDGRLLPEVLHDSAQHRTEELVARMRQDAVLVGYPLVEAEVVRRRRAQVVKATDRTRPRAFADAMGWSDYVVAPVVLGGRVTGLFQADRRDPESSPDARDAAALGSCAAYFALVYERAVLRQRLHEQRQEMGRIATWADVRTSELADRSITLTAEPLGSRDDTHATPPAGGENALRDLLTRRELDVLQLMVGGVTNAGIAKDLVLSEGTVKFHVKNILRKLHVANRAEATSRYLRLTLSKEARRTGKT